jgi:hypothetical protein
MLGGTRNADLLCSYRGRARLIEVKSSADGRAAHLEGYLLRGDALGGRGQARWRVVTLLRVRDSMMVTTVVGELEPLPAG